MTPRPVIDLNCDLGEGAGHDEELIPLVSSVNIACGGHAGDDDAMRQAVRTAKAHGVSVGAHPGYEDRANFGRVEVALPTDVVAASVERQVRRLVTLATAEGVRVGHVKPHGALYHAAERDAGLADALVAVLVRIDPALALVGPPGGHLATAAGRAGVRFVAEGFADRRYRADGRLVPRTTPGAVLDDADAVARQAIGLVTRGVVTAEDGSEVRLAVATLCTHGDGAHAVESLRGLRQHLLDHGVSVRAF